MSQSDKPDSARRRFLNATAALGSGTLGSALLPSQSAQAGETVAKSAVGGKRHTVPFHGRWQAGILEPKLQQGYSYFAALDVKTDKRKDLIRLFKDWSLAAQRLTNGLFAVGQPDSLHKPDVNTEEVLGLNPARLTLTFGFGAEFFHQNGKDRFALEKQRPDALVDTPKFPNDQIKPGWFGGALSIHAQSDDPQVAFNAVREMVSLSGGLVDFRWMMTGYLPGYLTHDLDREHGGITRDLLGFDDGIVNPRTPELQKKWIWVGEEGPEWMRDGSYQFFQRMQIDLRHWDQMPVDFQEKSIGRHKYSGAPLGKRSKYNSDGHLTPMDFKAKKSNGELVVPHNAHARLGSPDENNGVHIFRRSYNYSHGVSHEAERWPPWHQGMFYDGGLDFLSYQRDPRNSCIPMYARMDLIDAMISQFVMLHARGLFACPGGVEKGEYLAQRLLES
ncbi:MAG: Dyp-type peroxidase [Acidihalobacter sp.]|uniref:Dyp-type peroxidase n=1 Tax=Acidihalobacter sp. TaxID=1872108 RepID=UPI00307FB2D1